MFREAMVAAALVVTGAQSESGQVAPITGTLASGARWSAEVPANWNGTLLLYGRGYSGVTGNPLAAPKQHRQALLDAGYAILGSDYGSAGWALEQAVPAQRGALAAFTRRHGKPKRVIAWGESMGGLVSTALAEMKDSGIDGAAPLCASIGGSLGMMNMALDGAFAFRTLIAPASAIRIVGVDDDMANSKRVGEALAEATRSPEGRARVALAGVLAGIPGWTSRGGLQPAPGDYKSEASEMARAFVMGVYLPRVDQERRAGGVFSWNKGVDYRAQLARSGRRPLVEAMYRDAGLDLEADLSRLNAGKRIVARPAAVAYMRANYTPDARPRVPLVAVQTIGDGMTAPAMQRAYAETASGRDVKSLYVSAAGHCGFDTPTVVATIRYLDTRLATGKWPATPARFVPHLPAPMLRPCWRGGTCR